MSKLRVLHITFDMAIGGTEQVIRQLVLNLPAEIECQILCIDGRVGDIGQALQQQGTKVHVLPRKAGLDWQLIRNIRKLVREEGIDIVHCHQYTPWVYGWFAHWCTAAKVVFTEHGRFYPDRYRWKALVFNLLMALTSYRITAISRSTAKSLSKYEFIKPDLISVIYNGIKPLEVNCESVSLVRNLLKISDKKVIGTVARLDKIKNQSMLIKAFNRLVKSDSSLHLLIVGDGPEKDSLIKECLDLDILDKVTFTGFIREPASYLATIDVFVLCSFTEGTSMTLLEAMSLGVPCVATNVGGNSEIIKNDLTGLLVPSNDDLSLSSAINSFLNNVSFREKVSESAKESFHRVFSVDVMISNFLKVYKGNS